MSPRISTREAYTMDLPLNPFKRRRIVIGHLIDICQEVGLNITGEGFVGREALIKASEAADEIELARTIGGSALDFVNKKYGLIEDSEGGMSK